MTRFYVCILFCIISMGLACSTTKQVKSPKQITKKLATMTPETLQKAFQRQSLAESISPVYGLPPTLLVHMDTFRPCQSIVDAHGFQRRVSTIKYDQSGHFLKSETNVFDYRGTNKNLIKRVVAHDQSGRLTMYSEHHRRYKSATILKWGYAKDIVNQLEIATIDPKGKRRVFSKSDIVFDVKTNAVKYINPISPMLVKTDEMRTAFDRNGRMVNQRGFKKSHKVVVKFKTDEIVVTKGAQANQREIHTLKNNKVVRTELQTLTEDAWRTFEDLKYTYDDRRNLAKVLVYRVNIQNNIQASKPTKILTFAYQCS